MYSANIYCPTLVGLDNYITIQGIVNGSYTYDNGYLYTIGSNGISKKNDNTYSYLKLRANLASLINEYKVFGSNEEIKFFVCEYLKQEEEKFKPSKKNWSLIINEMDSILTDKIKEKL